MAACQLLHWPRPCCSLPGHRRTAAFLPLPLCPSLFFSHIKLSAAHSGDAVQSSRTAWHTELVPSPFVSCVGIFPFPPRLSVGTPLPVPHSFCQALQSWLISNPMEFMSPVGSQETLHAGNKLLSLSHEKCSLILKVPWNPAQVCVLFQSYLIFFRNIFSFLKEFLLPLKLYTGIRFAEKAG